jgi:hypothetical protein
MEDENVDHAVRAKFEAATTIKESGTSERTLKCCPELAA